MALDWASRLPQHLSHWEVGTTRYMADFRPHARPPAHHALWGSSPPLPSDMPMLLDCVDQQLCWYAARWFLFWDFLFWALFVVELVKWMHGWQDWGRPIKFFWMMTKMMRQTWGWHLINYKTSWTRLRLNGVLQGKRTNIERARVLMDERMHLDYFVETPVWGPFFFRHCYCMKRSLFLIILDRVCTCDTYFLQKKDVCGLVGLSSCQKIIAALWMLALGVCTDAMDNYCRTSESTTIECMKRFCGVVCEEFGKYHLRQPT